VRDYAIILLDLQGRICSWNEGARLIKGYQPEEIIGESMFRFYTEPDRRRRHPAQLLKRAELEGRVEEEGWRVRKDGTLFWADVVITALRDEAGRLRGYAKVTRDLTERMRSEASLRESQERLRAIYDHNPSIMFLKDPQGRYLDCNPPFEAFLGQPRSRILGKTDADLLPPEQAEQFMANDRRVLSAGRPMSFEEIAIHPDGPRISIVSKFPLRNVEGRVYALGGIVTDITDRKSAEESLRRLSIRLLQLQDEEQERIARELQQGVAQTLDALRAQLAVVRSSGTLFDWKTSEALDKCLGLAKEASTDVRTLSRFLYPSLLDDAGLVEALRWFAGSVSQRSGIKVVLDAGAKFGRLSREAERSLFRVAQESLVNIQRHSGSPVATIRVTEDAYAIRLEVRDEGRGLPDASSSKNPGAKSSMGSGIRGMIERMRLLGGHLEIDSAGGGTTVRAILPISAARRGPGLVGAVPEQSKNVAPE